MHRRDPAYPSPLGKSITRIHRLAQAYFTRELAPFGLSAADYPLLLALYHGDDRRQEDLAADLSVDKAAVKRAADDLEAEGYLVRREDPGDRRAWRLCLTPLALERKRAISVVLATWTRSLRTGLSAEEADHLERTLELVAANALAAAHTGERNGS